MPLELVRVNKGLEAYVTDIGMNAAVHLLQKQTSVSVTVQPA